MKSFVIVLQESEHSCRVGQEVIDSANKFNVYPEIHPAVLGYNSLQKFNEYGIKRFLTRDILDNPGHQGCFLSHFELWMKCVKLDEPIIILEHDAVFVRELPSDILNQFDGVLKLDPYDVFDTNTDYNKCVEDSLDKAVSVWHQPARNKWHGVGEFIWGAYGYIIKPHAALSLIQFARKIGAAPTDVHIGRNLVDIKSTTVPIVKMNKKYIDGDIKAMSSTSNLNQYITGYNSLMTADYLSPKKYKELIETLDFLEEVDIN
jgi:GR25 family glycosyltransferase involved in LPS biosynthesis